MTQDTFTPLNIDGAIWVVKNAPGGISSTLLYNTVLAACTKYPTLPADKEYWQSKIGVRLEEGEISKRSYDTSRTDFDVYAIPKPESVGTSQKPSTFPYLSSEYELQIQRMEELGINTTGCTFEQSVNAALFMLRECKKPDGDLWDEAEESIERDFGIPIKNLTGEAVIFYLKQHYSLKRK